MLDERMDGFASGLGGNKIIQEECIVAAMIGLEECSSAGMTHDDDGEIEALEA
jgi:hypothetical protein